jgi:hypothetical protein
MPRGTTSRRVPMLLSLPFLLAASGPVSQEEQGRQLFMGEQPVDARMVGHTAPLPAQAYRCDNCHSSSTTRPRAEPDFAPLLSKQTLTQRITRRGGPPSSYDAKVFCKVLRDGIDPAYVMINQAMPRYRLNDRECETLWTYLML